MSLIPCHIPPSHPNNANVEKIVELYSATERLGASVTNPGTFEGVNGIVLKVKHAFDEKVVKIVRFNEESKRELEVSCKLESISHEAVIFTHVFGYLHGDYIPDKWGRYIVKRPPNFDLEDSALLFIFMDFVPNRIMSPSTLFSIDEFKELVYIILHGLYTAFNSIGFTHVVL